MTPTPKGEKMTAMERAKSCLPGCYDPTGRECTADEQCEIHFRVAEEIKTAEDAARAEGNLHCSLCHEDPDKFGLTAKDWKPGCCCKTQQSIKEAYAKGFADAVEKAAELSWSRIRSRDEAGKSCCASTAQFIGRDIRALRPSGSGEEKLK